jgi:N-acyl homoserine lactone hydrolase
MKLYLLHLGSMIADDTPIPGYLVQLDDGTNVVIDTGYRPGSFGEDQHPERAAFRVHPEEAIVNQLARLGLELDDIDYVVSSHFDPDHAGYLDVFPCAAIVVQRSHLAAARASDHLRFVATRQAWDLPDERYLLVDGDTELLPGIELIETSGHVLGHQAVLLRLPHTGSILLPIDAMDATEDRDTHTGQANPFDMDPALAAASRRKLQTIRRREGVALTIYGHDRQQWQTLRKAPDYYS